MGAIEASERRVEGMTASDDEWNNRRSGALKRTEARGTRGKLHRCIALRAEVLLMRASVSQVLVVSLVGAGLKVTCH